MPKLEDIKKKAENRLDLDKAPDEIRAKMKEMKDAEKGYNIILKVDLGDTDNIDDMPILENRYTERFLQKFIDAMENLGYDTTDNLMDKFHIWKRESGGERKEGKITYFPRHYPIKVDE